MNNIEQNPIINEQTATDYEQKYYEAVELLQQENISETDRLMKQKELWLVYGPYITFKQRSRELNTLDVIEVPMRELIEPTMPKSINEQAWEF